MRKASEAEIDKQRMQLAAIKVNKVHPEPHGPTRQLTNLA